MSRAYLGIIGLAVTLQISLAAPAPSFTLPTRSGTLTLDSLRGRVVYLDFWASWCDPCRRSFPWMDDVQKELSGEGLTVVAVNLDSERSKADKFLARHPAGFTIAFDPTGDVARLYTVKGMPSSYLINRQGEIVATHIGFREGQAKELKLQIEELLKK